MRARWLMLLCLLVAPSCDAPLVAQGTVQSYSEESHLLVLQSDRGGQELRLSIEGAEIGAEIKVGDLIRLAYRDESGTLRATRIMNLTRQQELAAKK